MLKLKKPNYTIKELELLDKLKEELKNEYPSYVIDILFYRNIRTIEEIDMFFHSTLHHLHNTELMKDSDKFIKILKETIDNDEVIVIYSDYDVDGATCAAIGILSISSVGGKVHYYTNNRFIGGYGINKAGIDDMLLKYPETKLIITTDNGIVANEAIDYAKSKGLKIIITDHHESNKEEIDGKIIETLPNADAVIDPKQLNETYPFKGLCGCGIIFKLMLYYYFFYGYPMEEMYKLLDIVALGTVGDVVPLVDENRILVKEGLKLLQNDSRFCFHQLRLKLDITKIDEDTLGFVYGPIMNATGRLDGTPDKAIDFLISSKEEEVLKLIPSLVILNEERKAMTLKQYELAESFIDETKLPNIIISYHESFHEGLVGLVAGRLKEKFGRPTIVFSKTETYDEKKGYILKASARSIHSINMYENLKKLSSYLVGFGGHAMAAGLSIYESDLDEFTKNFNKLLKEASFEEYLIVDTMLNAEDITIDLIETLELLKPFGSEFEKPNFGIVNFEVNLSKSKKIYIGSNSDSVRLVDSNGLTLLMFRNAALYQYYGEPTKVKGVGSPKVNVWNGTTSPQFIIKDNLLFPE